MPAVGLGGRRGQTRTDENAWVSCGSFARHVRGRFRRKDKKNCRGTGRPAAAAKMQSSCRLRLDASLRDERGSGVLMHKPYVDPDSRYRVGTSVGMNGRRVDSTVKLTDRRNKYRQNHGQPEAEMIRKKSRISAAGRPDPLKYTPRRSKMHASGDFFFGRCGKSSAGPPSVLCGGNPGGEPWREVPVPAGIFMCGITGAVWSDAHRAVDDGACGG